MFMSEKIGTRKRVLVVDDDPGIGKVLRISLALSGFDVSATTDSTEAVHLVQACQPDIVLLDMVMEGLTGLEVLEQVRAFSQVPVIMFTGRSELAQLAEQAGANDSIGKPFDPHLLAEKIRRALNTPCGA